jgi:hypothetical protein
MGRKMSVSVVSMVVPKSRCDDADTSLTLMARRSCTAPDGIRRKRQGVVN